MYEWSEKTKKKNQQQAKKPYVSHNQIDLNKNKSMKYLGQFKLISNYSHIIYYWHITALN